MIDVLSLIINAVGIVLVFVGIIYTIRSLNFARESFEQQMQVQTFFACTQRYDEIHQSFPRKYRFGGGLETSIDDVDHSEMDEVKGAVVRYLNLCSEEYHLWSKRLISDEVWSIWNSEMQSMLAQNLIATYWPQIRAEYPDHEFQKFVDQQTRVSHAE